MESKKPDDKNAGIENSRWRILNINQNMKDIHKSSCVNAIVTLRRVRWSPRQQDDRFRWNCATGHSHTDSRHRK